MIVLMLHLLGFIGSNGIVVTQFHGGGNYMPTYAAVRGPCTTLHVIYMDSLEVYHRFSTDDGRSWSERDNVSESPDRPSYSPALAVDRFGRVHVSWAQPTAIPEVEVFYRRKDNTGWTPVRQVSHLRTRGGTCNFSALVCDSSGRAHLVWDAIPPGTRPSIWYSIGEDTSWTEPLNLSGSAVRNHWPRIAIDRSDNLCVVWSRKGGFGIFRDFCRFYRDGDWLPEHRIDNPPDSLLHHFRTNVVADEYGRFHAVWYRVFIRPVDTLYVVYYAVHDQGWSEPKLISDSVHNRPMHVLDMTADAAGRVTAIWPQRHTGRRGQEIWELMYRGYDDQLQWSEIKRLTQDTSWSLSYRHMNRQPRLAKPALSDRVDLLWDHPSGFQFGDLMYLTLPAPSSSGMVEEPGTVSLFGSVAMPGTVVRGVVAMPESAGPRFSWALYSISGRRVMGLQPGENDVRHLAPGVYFIREAEHNGHSSAGYGDERRMPGARRVVVLR